MNIGTITRSLMRARRTGDNAVDSLYALVYDELSRIARRHLSRMRPGETINTSALVHDSYLRLVAQTKITWESRLHFFATASRVMRQILVDFARKKGAKKRSGLHVAANLEYIDVSNEAHSGLILALNEALERLNVVDERLARVVECRFFGGLTEEETAQVLGVSERTVRRDWIKAKAWLQVELTRH